MASINVEVKGGGDFSPQELVDKGLIEHQKGELDVAACFYQAAIEKDNHQSDALHLLGMIAFQLQQPLKAEKLILLAIQNNPNVPVFHNNLGNLYLNNGEVELALEAYQTAVSLKADYAEAKFNLANAYVEYGDYGLAEIFYVRALEIAPEFDLALTNLGELYIEQQKWAEAKKCYERLIELEPNNEENKQRLTDLQIVIESQS